MSSTLETVADLEHVTGGAGNTGIVPPALRSPPSPPPAQQDPWQQWPTSSKPYEVTPR